MLEEIERRGFHARMGRVPRAATDVVKFHGNQAVHFHESCNPRWKDMANAARLRALRIFLYTKFSISHDPSVIVPWPFQTYRQSDICWNTFWMTRKEIDDIALKAFQVYLKDAECLGFR